MTASSSPVLTALHERHGERIRFLTVYVREAHPGDRYPQPATMEQKIAHANAFAARDHIRWPVAVDDLDGSLHAALDYKSNVAVFADPAGQVVHRTLWANDRHAVERGLEQLLGLEEPGRADDEPHLVPMLAGLGAMHTTLEGAGKQAQRDMIRAVPPMYALGRVARLFGPLPPAARGAVATASVAAASVGAVALIRRLRR
jgi:hypothetical protein